MLETIILCLVASLVFAAVRWLMAGRANAFVTDWVSLGLALLVFASQSIFGWKL